MMDSYSMGRFALGALWVFFLLGLTLWWIKKKKGMPFSKVQSKHIQVLEVHPLGLKTRLMLLEVDGQRVLVGVNAQEVKTLHTWSPSFSSPTAASDWASSKEETSANQVFGAQALESMVVHHSPEGVSS